MSLLSEDVSQVSQSQNLTVQGLTIVAPPVSTHFSMLSGSYKQVVGYAMPTTEEYTYVLDTVTGEPLRMPDGYVPTVIGISSIQDVMPNDNSIYFYMADSASDPANANTLNFTSYTGAEIKSMAYYYFAEYVVDPVSALACQGYNWILLQNLNPSIPFTSGIIKVVIQYQKAK